MLSVLLNGDDHVEIDTDKDLHWDQMDMGKIRAMAFADPTQRALEKRLNSIAGMLRGIPELASTAQFYGSDQIDGVVAAALRRQFVSSPRPELLGTLLDLEARLVDDAVGAALEVAHFRQVATTKPAKALKHLAEFGEDLAKTFNEIVGGHPFLSGAARPLGTLLFLEAAATFDPLLTTAALAARMDLTVIQSGKLTINEMLTGKIPDDLILYEQPFMQTEE